MFVSYLECFLTPAKTLFLEFSFKRQENKNLEFMTCSKSLMSVKAGIKSSWSFWTLEILQWPSQVPALSSAP